MIVKEEVDNFIERGGRIKAVLYDLEGRK